MSSSSISLAQTFYYRYNVSDYLVTPWLLQRDAEGGAAGKTDPPLPRPQRARLLHRGAANPDRHAVHHPHLPHCARHVP
jgi:hypothetical protein